MAKRYYFSKGNFGAGYFLDDGSYGKRRIELGNDPDFLIHEIKSRLDKGWKKRKTDFYIVKDNISEESVKKLRKLFSDSKVKISLVSLLNVS